jgi:hypothetical protein
MRSRHHTTLLTQFSRIEHMVDMGSDRSWALSQIEAMAFNIRAEGRSRDHEDAKVGAQWPPMDGA